LRNRKRSSRIRVSWDVADLEFSIVPAMADIELKGILLTRTSSKKYGNPFKRGLWTSKGVFVSSDLLLLLSSTSPQCLKRTRFRAENTSDKTLEGIDHPFAKTMLEHREVSKLFHLFREETSPAHQPGDGSDSPGLLQLGTDRVEYRVNVRTFNRYQRIRNGGPVRRASRI